jgi:tetratricopeptide (TPR) repeat protein
MTRFPRPVARAVSLAAIILPALAATPVLAVQSAEEPEVNSLAGGYLAARTADVEKDVESAAHFYRETLKADPGNLFLLERAAVLSASAGEMDQALDFARQLKDASPKNTVAGLITAVEDIRTGDNAAAIETLRGGDAGVLADLTSALLVAWATFGEGNVDDALNGLDELQGETWYEPFKLLHSGYIALAGGRMSQALDALKAAQAQDANAVRITEAYATALAAAGREEEAEKLLNDFLERFPDNALAQSALRSIRAGEPPVSAVVTPVEGAAEALAGVGAAVGQEGGTEVAYLYLRLALHLDPQIAGGLAALSLGNLLDANGQGDAAIAVFESIAPGEPFRNMGRLRAALAMERMDEPEDAERTFKQALAADPNSVQTYISYGNMLRGRERFAEAAKIYTGAIDLVPNPGPADWSLFYFRGICFERTDEWDKAEADFRKALELSPDQPLVLNYLGYSWADMGINLDEAMANIGKAVNLRPNDGYIVDSLGWAHYRLGEYEDAVKELERAVSLRPDDPVINDHLGDAYWQTGRTLEAQFQWRHARDFGAEGDTLKRVLKKIAEGRLVDDAPVSDAEEPTKHTMLYTVKPGDSLWTISAALLKSGEAFGKIFDANKDKLSSPDEIYPGMQLRIPGEI